MSETPQSGDPQPGDSQPGDSQPGDSQFGQPQSDQPGAASGPGWHADPAGAENTFRWWDGEQWTTWLSDDAGAPAPEAATSTTAAAQAPPQSATQRPPGYERSAKPAAAQQRTRPRRLPLVVGAIVVAVIVVIAIVVYGNRSGPGLAVPPADSSSSSTPSTGAVSLDNSSRKMTIGTFSVELPGDPYTFDDSVLNYPPMLSSGVLATAPVNKEYDGKHTWFAAMFVGQLDPEVVVEGDAKKTADQVFQGVVSINYSDTETTTDTYSTKAVTQEGTKRAAVARGHVNYQIEGVPSRFDQVSVLVVELDDGTWVGYLTARPDKAPQKVRSAQQASIDSITVG